MASWAHLEAQAAGSEGELRGAVGRALGVCLKAAHAEQGAVAGHLHSLHPGAAHSHELPAVGEPRPLKQLTCSPLYLTTYTTL